MLQGPLGRFRMIKECFSGCKSFYWISVQNTVKTHAKKNAVSVANKSGLQIFEKVKCKIALELLAMSLCTLCVQNECKMCQLMLEKWYLTCMER